MSDSGKAVFLSYASQDAEAVKRIADALRAADVEVWFDQSELGGGDAWDAKIRGQISSCALFVPIISANTQARREGYFRIEWKLAAQRTHAMSDDTAFLLPVVIDDTNDALAKVPAEFKAVQWTRLPGGEAPTAFGARVRKLLEGEIDLAGGALRPDATGLSGHKAPPTQSRRGPGKWWWALPIFGVMMALFLVMKEGHKEPPPAPAPVPAVAPQSEARQLVAKAWVLLNKPEMARAELDAADALCKRAAALDPTDAEVWAAWAHVNVWYWFHNLDSSPQRQEAGREYAARAMQLVPQSFEARLAQAFYWVRGESSGRRVEEAQRLLRELLRERPDEPRVLFTLGFSFISKPSALAEGIGLLERLALNPRFAAVACDEIGWIYYFTGEPAKAEDAVARSLAAQPYWNNLGLKITLAERVHGDMDLAESTLQQMPASALQEDWGIGFACEVYQWRREPLRTIQVLEGLSRDWIHYYFNDYPKAFLLGQARLMASQASAAQRDFQRARVLIEKQLADDPNNVYLLGLQARTLFYLGEKEEAAKSYRLVKELGRADTLQIHFEPPDVAIAYIRSMAQSTDASAAVVRSYFSPASLRLDPQFDRLRPEPAFQALLAELDAGKKPAASRSPASSLPSPSHPPEADAKSVAVLAFANLSDDKANEYFSDGISEELLNVLAKVPGLKVSARTSAFYFKGKEVPIPEIAQKLGVAYVVEGSVRKSGDKVRITAQLIKAADGFHVWSDTFTRDLKDIFAVQDEIAGLIAKNLEMKMGAAAPTRTVDPEAYRLYLEALPAITSRTFAGLDQAEQLITQAIARDPGLVPAQAALAIVWGLRAQQRGELDDPDSPVARRVVAQAEMAVRLGPDWAEAQAACGYAYSVTLRFDEAEPFLRRAIQLNPSYASAHLWLGRTLLAAGRMDEALKALRQATDLDPFAHRALDNYAFALVDAGRPQDALAFIERALRIQPDSVQALLVKSQILTRTGRLPEALSIMDRLVATESPGNVVYAIEVFALAGRRAPLEGLLTGSPPLRPLDRFITLVALGRNEEALTCLSQAKINWAAIDYILFSPQLDSIRREPAFLAKLRESGLTEAHDRAQAWRAAQPPEKLEGKK